MNPPEPPADPPPPTVPGLGDVMRALAEPPSCRMLSAFADGFDRVSEVFDSQPVYLRASRPLRAFALRRGAPGSIEERRVDTLLPLVARCLRRPIYLLLAAGRFDGEAAHHAAVKRALDALLKAAHPDEIGSKASTLASALASASDTPDIGALFESRRMDRADAADRATRLVTCRPTPMHATIAAAANLAHAATYRHRFPWPNYDTCVVAGKAFAWAAHGCASPWNGAAAMVSAAVEILVADLHTCGMFEVSR